VRRDCADEADLVESALPTVVVIVRDDRGHDLKDVTLEIDQRVVSRTLDGNAIEVDAGERAFHLEVRGGPVIDQKVLVHAGEKNRPITFALHGDVGAAGASVPTPVPAPSPSPAPAGGGGGEGAREDRDPAHAGATSSDQLWNTQGRGGGHEPRRIVGFGP